MLLLSVLTKLLHFVFLVEVLEVLLYFAFLLKLWQFCYTLRFLLKIWQFCYIYPLFETSLLFLYLTCLLKVWAFLVHFSVFAERIFCVTFRSYWKWGKFLSMVRFWLKSSSVSLTLHYCCWKFLRGNLSLAVNYAGCIEFVISYFHTFQSEVSYAW